MADKPNLPVLAHPAPSSSRTAEEYMRSLVKGGVNAIPFVGGLLGEIIDATWIPQHAKKTQDWFDYADSTLKMLVDKGTITVESLINDPQFAGLFQKTTKIYLDNVETSKRPAIQAALKFSIDESIPLDKKYIFLRVLDDLTGLQIQILQDIHHNKESDNYLYQTQLEIALAEKYCDGKADYLHLLVKGLADNHLITYASAKVILDGANQWDMVTSEIGDEFLAYISSE